MLRRAKKQAVTAQNTQQADRNNKGSKQHFKITNIASNSEQNPYVLLIEIL